MGPKPPAEPRAHHETGGNTEVSLYVVTAHGDTTQTVTVVTVPPPHPSKSATVRRSSKPSTYQHLRAGIRAHYRVYLGIR